MVSRTCEFLEWDSQFFGVRIARLNEPSLSPISVASALHWCRANQIDCLYFLVASDHAETVRLAQQHAFQLVDVRVTLEHALSGPLSPTPAVRPFQPTDAAALRAIARMGHQDSRFYYDGHFPLPRCADLYEAWINRSMAGRREAVLVADYDGTPAGYISCRLDPSGVGAITLFAVAQENQRKGLGPQLVAAALEYFRQNGMTQVLVVTQARNIAAQRAYQRCGFLTRSTQLWYHAWFSTPLPT